jgi:hypothetical protein
MVDESEGWHFEQTEKCLCKLRWRPKVGFG